MKKYKQKFDIEKFPKTFAYVLENDTFTKRCNRCGSVVLNETQLDYPYQCMKCNENMYGFEVHDGEPHTTEEMDELCCNTRDILELDK